MLDRRRHDCPMASHDVRVTPELQDNPDIKKLWQALIAAAINLAEKKKAEEAVQKAAEFEEGNMT